MNKANLQGLNNSLYVSRRELKLKQALFTADQTCWESVHSQHELAFVWNILLVRGYDFKSSS